MCIRDSLKVRAPDDAETAEVNLFLQGEGKAWFDDIFFAPAPAGTISGIVTSGGGPLEGARVMIWGDTWGKTHEAFSDASGYYEITDVPVAFPRYILLAGKEGHKTKPQGEVEVAACESATVDFELETGSDPTDNLRVKFGSLAHVTIIPGPEIPPDAQIPSDPTGYPEPVREFLQADEFIESDNPQVIDLANSIIESLPPDSRTNAGDVAYAVYEWVSKNIEHDGVYTYNAPAAPEGTRIIPDNEDFGDVTSGIYQTVTDKGWCWGRNFYDWEYKPSELIEVEGGICAEHAWLDSALLRALGIPARAAIGYNQFWVHPPSGEGFWAFMSTTGGRTSYRKNGLLGPGFNALWPNFYSVLSRPLLHEDWNWENPGMWKEIHPYEEMYEDSPSGLAAALAALAEFETSGESPFADPLVPPFDSYYLIHYSDITLNLYNMGTQRSLDVRFPFVSESDSHAYAGHEDYWTSHPECVVRTRVEDITNPPVEGAERWFHIEFDLTDLIEGP